MPELSYSRWLRLLRNSGVADNIRTKTNKISKKISFDIRKLLFGMFTGYQKKV